MIVSKLNHLRAIAFNRSALFLRPCSASQFSTASDTNTTFNPQAHFQDPADEWADPSKRKLLGAWLLLCAGGVYFMVLLGGYTRLTHSGLSMTKWKPIEYHYPSNQDEWEKEFDHYKQYPEYQHTPITIEKFKRIYLVEYLHRVSGSTLGAVYLLPFAAFSALKWIKAPLMKRLGIMGGLGLCQGLIGWWMVKSGFEQPKPAYQTKPRVSTYRLMVHLSMALGLYSTLLWHGATLLRKPQHHFFTPENYRSSMKMRGLSIGLIHLVALNLISGATMAGIDAGKVFNTWPLMNGQLIPAGLGKVSPFWKNFIENNVMVQFNHRNAAYLTYGFASFVAYQAYRKALPRNVKFLSYGLFALVNYQLLTGIVALLNQVQVHSGSIHQFNALNVLTCSLLLCHSLRKPSPAYQKYLQQFIK